MQKPDLPFDAETETLYIQYLLEYREQMRDCVIHKPKLAYSKLRYIKYLNKAKPTKLNYVEIQDSK